MSEYSYIKLNHYMLAHPRLTRAASIASASITTAVYIFYPLFLLCYFFFSRVVPFRMILVPLISLVVISILRRALNIKRPYEMYAITPLNGKRTKGESLPSRHTFCIFIIAFTFFYISPTLFSVLTLLGIILAFLRVILGVHLVRDVLAGLLCAILSAVIGYIII